MCRLRGCRGVCKPRSAPFVTALLPAGSPNQGGILLSVTCNASSAPIEDLAGQLKVSRISARAIGGFLLKEAIVVIIRLVLLSSASSLIMARPRVCAKRPLAGYMLRQLVAKDGPPREAIALRSREGDDLSMPGYPVVA